MSKNPQMIFVNLPVASLPQSKAFYEVVGFTTNPQFSDDTSACMVLSASIMVMLLTHAKWARFTSKTIPDAKATAHVLLCISRENREAVDTIVETAVRQGGTADPTPVQDLGFMYGRSFEDPDGHIWETVWMNPAGGMWPDRLSGTRQRCSLGGEFPLFSRAVVSGGNLHQYPSHRFNGHVLLPHP